MKREELEKIIRIHAKQGDCIGLIGVGKFGTILQKTAQKLGMTILLHDPPREIRESEDTYEAFQPQWGNGMGGCDFSKEIAETFLPLSILLSRASLLTIQVPLVSGGRFPTEGMIDQAFLDALRPGTRVLNFSGTGILSAGISDPRILNMTETA